MVHSKRARLLVRWLTPPLRVRACMCILVYASVRACVRMCVCACVPVRACVRRTGEAGRAGGTIYGKHIITAVSTDGLEFVQEPGERVRSNAGVWDAGGITKGVVLPPTISRDSWVMLYVG